jgi:hypothetical protein
VQCVRQRVQESRALGRRRLPPRAGERGAGGLDGTIYVCLACHRGLRQGLAGRRLDELTHRAVGRLHELTVDVEAVLALDRDRHRAGI